MATLNDKVRSILDKKVFVHLATLMPDGSPQVSPVWAEADGDLILINSAEGRVKDRNIRRDGRVALSMTNPDNPYQAVMIRGRVVDVVTEGGEAHIDKLAKKYMGVDEYPYKGDDVRVIYKIEPESIATMN